MQAKMLVMALALLVSVPMTAPAFAQSAPVAAPTAPVTSAPGAPAPAPVAPAGQTGFAADNVPAADVTLIGLFLQASWVVKAIMIGLLAA
ncbi:MAG: flagellar motor protein MotA, partial [Pseudomonadota bacterium]